MSESQDKSWEPVKFKIQMAQVDPRDMLNNFCLHVYAQKSRFIGENGNGFFLPPPHPHPYQDRSSSWFPAKNCC